MATSKFQVGDLVFRYGSRNRFRQWNVGIVEELPAVETLGDERHANIRLLDGSLKWIDVGQYGSAGRPISRKGRVVVKWIDARWVDTQTLDEISNKLGQHEELDAEMFAEDGWALVRDPWGEQHWLPPRRETGEDSIYVFDRGTGQVFVTMQQTMLPPKR